MSSCNDYAEFLATLCLETGARPHVVAPLARRLRRLATTHARRCETACNGCRRCEGSGYIKMWYHDVEPTIALPCEADTIGAHPCPQCSTDTVERAIEETCRELRELRREYCAQLVALAALEGRDATTLPREWCPMTSPHFTPTFQGDPRGATVRLRVPSGASGDWGGVVVPTSGRA